MTKYLISFPSEAMVDSEEDFEAVLVASHAVIDEAKAAGVYVFGGGINEGVDPVLVAGDGTVTQGTSCPTADTPFSSCPRGRRRTNGPQRSPWPAAARKKSGSSSTIRQADEGSLSLFLSA